MSVGVDLFVLGGLSGCIVVIVVGGRNCLAREIFDEYWLGTPVFYLFILNKRSKGTGLISPHGESSITLSVKFANIVSILLIINSVIASASVLLKVVTISVIYFLKSSAVTFEISTLALKDVGTYTGAVCHVPL